MKRLYAAVDLGATNVRAAAGDATGIKRRIAEPTDKSSGAEGIAAQIIRMIRALDTGELAAVGVGSIGPLDLDAGCVVDTPNLPFLSLIHI